MKAENSLLHFGPKCAAKLRRPKSDETWQDLTLLSSDSVEDHIRRCLHVRKT